MKFIALVLTGLFLTATSFAANPVVNAQELTGVYQGNSINGPCSVKLVRGGDILIAIVSQNMTTTRSLPISVTALTQKISGDKCGSRTNNECGSYSLEDKIQNGAGYNNQVEIAASNEGGQRCLQIHVNDASYNQFIGGNHCKVNLNRSGRGCRDN